MLDVQRLIGEVASKHGIRLEPNDPAFALVTLNQLVLEETAARLSNSISTILTDFSTSLNKAERRAGATLAQDVRSALTAISDLLGAESEVQKRNARESSTCSRTVEYRWAALGLAAATLILGIGVAIGMVITGR